jgi:hypothetical protein
LLKMSLSKTIAELRAELASNPFGELPLWARLRLWQAMEEEFPRDSGMRRSYFALFVLDKLLPTWDRANMPLPYRDLPHLLRLAARLHLNGVTSRVSVASVLKDCHEVHQYRVCACDCETYGNAGLVQEAAEFVADRALGNDDERYRRMELYDESELPDVAARPTEVITDPGVLWDCHWVGSVLAAGRAVWEENPGDTEARRAYWKTWLDEWLPQFTGDLGKAQEAAGLTVLPEHEDYCQYFREEQTRNKPSKRNEKWFWVYSAQGERLGWGSPNLPNEIAFYVPGDIEEAYAGVVVGNDIKFSSGRKTGRVDGTNVFDDEGTLVAHIRDEKVVSFDGKLLVTIFGNVSNEARGAAALLLAIFPQSR